MRVAVDESEKMGAADCICLLTILLCIFKKKKRIVCGRMVYLNDLHTLNSFKQNRTKKASELLNTLKIYFKLLSKYLNDIFFVSLLFLLTH